MPNPTSYVTTLDAAQAAQLREILADRGWELDTIPYARWRARRNKTTATAYESGKCTVQGRDTAELVQFIIEPIIVKEARFGYETELAEVENPAMFEPHAGIDESGKGDYFGPLVIAAAFVDTAGAKALLAAGVQDSKAIKSARMMATLAEKIVARGRRNFSIVVIGPEAYNRMYAKIGNLNRLLAWGHARALENLLEQRPDCARAISDQFGNKATVLRALGEKGRAITLEQRPKAEADVAVAAASILARNEFVNRLAKLGESLGVTLPKGASAQVLQTAKDLAGKHGEEALGRVAKLHFRTTALALGRPVGD